MGREKRAAKEKEGESSCPAVEKRWLQFFREREEEKARRAPRTLASPSNRLARRRGSDASQALEVAEGATRQGKRGQKRSFLFFASLTHHPVLERWKCIIENSLRSLSTNTKKTTLTRPSAVPGWRVPRRPPLWQKVAKKRGRGGGLRKRKRRKKTRWSLFLFLVEEEGKEK